MPPPLLKGWQRRKEKLTDQYIYVTRFCIMPMEVVEEVLKSMNDIAFYTPGFKCGWIDVRDFL